MYYIYNTCNILYEVFNVWMCFSSFYISGTTKRFDSSKNILKHFPIQTFMFIFYMYTSIIYK